MPRKEDNELYTRFPSAEAKTRFRKKLRLYKEFNDFTHLSDALEHALDIAIARENPLLVKNDFGGPNPLGATDGG